MNKTNTIREALEAYAANETEGMNGAFRACCSVRPNEPHAEHCMVNAALAALAELEAQQRDGSNWNPRPGWQQLADGTSCYTTTASTDQVAGEPVAWQRRMRPTWGSHSAYPWGPWEPCTKGQAEDHWKTPLLHDWAYEARALCLAAPVAQQAAPAKGSTYNPGDSDIYERWANKQPQAEAAVPDVTDVMVAAGEHAWMTATGVDPVRVYHAMLAAAPKGQP